ncbi:MAG: hypothetical protein O2782_21595 [bacterium]|nr:hypothetical protein [bacterium]
MSRPLPSQPNLRHLKNEAKKLHRDLENGAADAASRIAAHLPRLTGAAVPAVRAANVTLQETQHVLAREYGFATWADLAAAAASRIDLEPARRPLEQLSTDEVRGICHGVSRLVKAHGDSVATIGPGDFYRALEGMGLQTSPSVREFVNLAADGVEPEVICRLARNRGDTVARNLEIRRRLVLEGVDAIGQGQDPRFVLHRLDTVGNTGHPTRYREPEGTVAQLCARLAQTPAAELHHDELAVVLADLACIVRNHGVAALAEVMDAVNDEDVHAGLQMVLDKVDPVVISAELERRARDSQQVRHPFVCFGEGLAAALEGKTGADLDAAVEAVV